MAPRTDDVLLEIAAQVADCISQRGYAFIEDDDLDALAETLRSFLDNADIQVHPAQ